MAQEDHEFRREKLPAGSDMTQVTSTPSEGHQATGVRGRRRSVVW